MKAAEETDLLSQIEQHELDVPPADLIEKLTKTHFVTVFAKSFCKYSKRVKAFFRNKHIDFKAVDLDLLGEQGKEIQARLHEMTGQSTVPNVWVNGKFIGRLKLHRSQLFDLEELLKLLKCLKATIEPGKLRLMQSVIMIKNSFQVVVMPL